MLALCDQDPAVVFAGFNKIHFVATGRPEFGRPQVAGLGIKAQPCLIAMPERVNLGQVFVHADERIVIRNRAVVIYPQDLSEMRLRILGFLAPIAVARRDIEPGVVIERDACTEASR